MKTYIALGSNLGDRELNIERAIRRMETEVGTLLASSALYYSEPQGFSSENYFVNAVVLLDTELSPVELLKSLQRIERNLGRVAKSVDGNYSDRIIDLDILIYEGVTMDTAELKIPHPLMRERDFVMKPLYELRGNGLVDF